MLWATETIEGSNAMDSMDPVVLQAYKRPYDPTWLLGYVSAEASAAPSHAQLPSAQQPP